MAWDALQPFENSCISKWARSCGAHGKPRSLSRIGSQDYFQAGARRRREEEIWMRKEGRLLAVPTWGHSGNFLIS